MRKTIYISAALVFITSTTLFYLYVLAPRQIVDHSTATLLDIALRKGDVDMTRGIFYGTQKAGYIRSRVAPEFDDYSQLKGYDISTRFELAIVLKGVPVRLKLDQESRLAPDGRLAKGTVSFSSDWLSASARLEPLDENNYEATITSNTSPAMTTTIPAARMSFSLMPLLYRVPKMSVGHQHQLDLNSPVTMQPTTITIVREDAQTYHYTVAGYTFVVYADDSGIIDTLELGSGVTVRAIAARDCFLPKDTVVTIDEEFWKSHEKTKHR
jgi:hypothetical protein